MKKFKIIAVIVILLLLAGGGFGLYYSLYQGSHFFYTENASVSADMVTITPEVTGKVETWNVKVGDDVKAGQILGRQDISSLITSSAINSQALSTTADALASKANIKSPIDGKVISSDVVRGEVVAPGLGIATIADTTNIYIKANIEETSIFKIIPGQKVDIRVDAYPGRQFTGYVENVGQATESVFSVFPSLNTSGTYSKVTQLIPVKINIVNEDNLRFLPGMNANVKIHIK